MDLSTPKYFQSPAVFASDNNNGELAMETSTRLYGKLVKNNPFADPFPIIPDPLCKLNLKETSDFVKSFPVPSASTTAAECRGFLDVSSSASAAAAAHERRREGVNSVTQKRIEAAAPSTPGRPVFSFSSVSNLSKKNFPSKWDDAEKWLMSSSCHDSPAHFIKSSLHSSQNHRQCDAIKQQIQEVFAEKSRVTEEKVSKVISSSFQGSSVVPFGQHNAATGFKGVPPTPTPGVLLKDKFTDEVEPVLPNFRYSEPSKQGFLFRNSARETMKDAGTEVVHELEHKDVGTEMTPLGSSTTSRCHTPFKSSSPARHNTPANRSGPLAMGNSGNGSSIDIFQLQECHFSKLQLGTQYDSITSNWSSRQEEEEEISKSLRHFETGNACRRSVSDSRAATWEEEEKTKCCLRYQREEAKIQAWVNLQSAKAEAQSRKLEVKIERMRSNLEEKLMKRMAVVHRKAEEWRATARQQHTEQMRRGSEQAHKIKSQQQQQQQVSGFTTCCGCFPCNINHH